MTENQTETRTDSAAMSYGPSYVRSINAAIERDREDLAIELAADYDAERGGRPSATTNSRRLHRWRHHASRVRRSVDDYTIDTFNPSPLLHNHLR